MRAAESDEAAVMAAARTVRSMLRGQYVGFDADDLRQEGRLAVWLARSLGRVPDDAEHARRYLRRRAQGAMLDCIRATRRQLPQQAQDIEDVVIGIETEPTARLRVRDAVRRLESRARPRVLECVDLLAQGHTPAETATAMSVSESRVSQMRRHAAELVGEW